MKVSKSTKIWHVNKGGFLTVTLDYQRCTSVGQGGGAMLHGGVRSTHEYHLITKSKYSAKRGYFRSSLWCTADADWFSAREIHWNVVCQKRVFQIITLVYHRCRLIFSSWNPLKCSVSEKGISDEFYENQCSVIIIWTWLTLRKNEAECDFFFSSELHFRWMKSQGRIFVFTSPVGRWYFLT